MNVVRSLFPLSPVRWVHLDPLVGPGFEPARRNAAARKHKGVRPLGVDHRQFQIGAVWRTSNRLPFHAESWTAYRHPALIFIKPPATGLVPLRTSPHKNLLRVEALGGNARRSAGTSRPSNPREPLGTRTSPEGPSERAHGDCVCSKNATAGSLGGRAICSLSRASK